MALEFRSGVKVEVAVLGSQSVIVLKVSVNNDVLIFVRCLISLMRGENKSI